MNSEFDDRPMYNAACRALKSAHEACFKHPDRGALGMSYGPFSGVNEALRIVDQLERRVKELERLVKNLEADLADARKT